MKKKEKKVKKQFGEERRRGSQGKLMCSRFTVNSNVVYQCQRPPPSVVLIGKRERLKKRRKVHLVGCTTTM